MSKNYKITDWFGVNLAELLSDKILLTHKKFNKADYVFNIEKNCKGKTYTQRVELFADELRNYLPNDYKQAVTILLDILGDENPNETGMFSNYYWVMPIGKFVEKYGLHDYAISIHAISEITKRNTGEYAIRPFIRKYPNKTIKQMKRWAKSDNFHMRRLSSEGLRPKLPWAPKLDTFVNNPSPVFEILELLKDDPVKFVKKSVANHLTDWLKVNRKSVVKVIQSWESSENQHTKWIIKHATRKIKASE